MKGERIERERVALLNKCTSWDASQRFCKTPNECGCLDDARASIKKQSPPEREAKGEGK